MIHTVHFEGKRYNSPQCHSSDYTILHPVAGTPVTSASIAGGGCRCMVSRTQATTRVETQGLRFTAFLFGLLRCKIESPHPKGSARKFKGSLFLSVLQRLDMASIIHSELCKPIHLQNAATPRQRSQTCLPSVEFPDLFRLIEVESVPVQGVCIGPGTLNMSGTFRSTIVFYSVIVYVHGSVSGILAAKHFWDVQIFVTKQAMRSTLPATAGSLEKHHREHVTWQ